MSDPRLLFVSTEDWFVRSHFLPLVRRALADGWRVAVAARMGAASDDLSRLGVELFPLAHARADNSVHAVLGAREELSGIFQKASPHLIHAIALKPALLTALARGSAPLAAQVYALTGLGHLGVSARPQDHVLRAFVLRVIALALRSERAALAVENAQDLKLLVRLAGPKAAKRAIVLPGAGVDPDLFAPGQIPSFPPVRIGFASRLVRSKGLDILIDAFARLRETDPDNELHVAGGIDPENPGGLDPAQLRDWSQKPGVRLHGPVTDMPGFWRNVHIACAPSRGGEGLPRTLLEAAACGLPIVATKVAGCREFVVDAQAGLLAPPGDSSALSEALRALITDPALRAQLGARARARVLAAYTEAHVADAAAAAWAALMGWPTYRAAGAGA